MQLRFALILALWVAVSPASAMDSPLDRISLPPGFHIELWAKLSNPRAMVLGGDHLVYVGSMRAGQVNAVRYDENYRATGSYRIADGLNMPAGLAYRDGSLYVSAVSRILRFNAIDQQPDHPPAPTVVTDQLPKEGHHGARYLAFGPDGKLYVPIGAPCNICVPEDGYAVILRMNPDGSGSEVFARGVRNPVGLAWRPGHDELWFTDNGRDELGDDIPPDELNRAPKPGLHFGYPYCHGGDLPDPEYGSPGICARYTPPARKLGAHVAALGLRFYTGKQFPKAYQGQIFIAEHGSWNRSKKSGYRITLARLKGNRVVAYEPFASGWLQGESAWGRPADLLVLPDGSLLVSDDQAGAIYRISYRQ
ncbi:MAG TPA: sorbosone dehydrogenase family protein [Rhodocyclaceae bacterium]